MKVILSLVAVFVLAVCVFGQKDLQKVVDTEHAFAAFAEKNSTKAGFLEYAAGDGVLFLPDKVNSNAYWNARGPSEGLLSWAPNFADVSANGIIGYTTGNWEYRPKGKSDEPKGFGEFVTIWLRQPDGRYKFVLDIGVGHEKPAKYSTEWATAAIKSSDLNEKNSSAADASTGFFKILTAEGPAKAYKMYAVDDLRAFREDKQPFIGRNALIAMLKKDDAKYELAKRSVFFGSADIAYNTNTYTRTVDGKIVEKGNTMQIWKLINGKWRIVLDIFKPVP